MKRFWLVLLSLGLIMAFSASAFAVDVKFSGSYYAAGMYMNRPTLDGSAIKDGPSSAFYFQRLRMQTDFVVSPGLTLITRFDALERVWGAARTAPGAVAQANSFGTTAENENIAFDYAYVKYDTPYGSFRVGAMPGGTWGTVFGDTSDPRWRLFYMSPSFSGLQILAIIEKNSENSYTVNNSATTQSEKDIDTYYIAGIYTSKMFTAGLLYAYQNNAASRTTTETGSKSKIHLIYPYFIANLGPVKIQGELDTKYGKKDYEAAATTDEDYESLCGWLDATATFGPVYVGATFAYAKGDKSATDNKIQGDLKGGLDYSPTLIMWNEDRARWFGSVRTTAAGASGFENAGLANAYFYQVRAGVKPTEKMDVCLAVSFMQADVVTSGQDDAMGYEIDLTGTYKITNNLSYMLGVGYLITGDYFKGTTNAETENDYLVINKLTLTF